MRTTRMVRDKPDGKYDGRLTVSCIEASERVVERLNSSGTMSTIVDVSYDKQLNRMSSIRCK